MTATRTTEHPAGDGPAFSEQLGRAPKRGAVEVPEKLQHELADVLESQFDLGKMAATGDKRMGKQIKVGADKIQALCDGIKRELLKDRVNAHASFELSVDFFRKLDRARADLDELASVMVRLVQGIDHLDALARNWEPDHSSGADRRGWLLAKDARDDAMKLLQELPARIRGSTTPSAHRSEA